MSSPDKCPFCGDARVVKGRFSNAGEAYAALFLPDDLHVTGWRKLLEGQERIKVKDEATACLQCGIVWGNVDLADACKKITRWGSDELRALLPSNRQP